MPFSPSYDNHMHTPLCGHAPDARIAHMVQRADALGLDSICFTEHVGHPDELERPRIIRGAVSHLAHRCRIFVGAEIDADRAAWDGRLCVDPPETLDYVLASIHFIPGTSVLPHCQAMPDLDDAVIFERWRSTLLGLCRDTRIDCIAHPGVMMLCARKAQGVTDDILQTFEEAAELARISGIAWELNNLVDHKLSPLQQDAYHRILQRGIDAGLRINYGSDAHAPAALGGTAFCNCVIPKLKNLDMNGLTESPCR